MKPSLSLTTQVSGVKLCRERAFLIDKQLFKPDQHTAYVEFYLSHAFPVTTIDGTAIHPQVVANSYRSMHAKVFDLAHLMRSYNPKENPRDRILGTVMAVEFPETPEGGWKVQGDKASAPGIRAVACMHKQAEKVPEILEKYFAGEIDWTVSMEQEYILDNSGFLVKSEDAEDFEQDTPADLLELGWTYVPVADAPADLRKCLDEEESKIIRQWHGAQTLILFGGLDGMIHYKGVGLTPLGKEKEAEVTQMLASKKMIEVGDQVIPDIFTLLKKTAELP